MSLKCQLHIFKIENGVEYRVEPFEIDLNSTGPPLHIFTEYVEMDKWQSLTVTHKKDDGQTIDYQCSLYERDTSGVAGRLKELITYMQQHPDRGAWHIYLSETKVASEQLSVLLTKLKSLSADAADTQAVHRRTDGPLGDWINGMTTAGYEITDNWFVTSSRTDRIEADIQLFLDWYSTYVGVRTNKFISGKMRRCQTEIHSTNLVSLGNLTTFIVTMDWLLTRRNIPHSQTG